MIPALVLGLINFAIFLTLCLVYTQEIYNKGSFRIPFLLSIILPAITFLSANKDNRFNLLLFSLIILYYSILLFILTKKYKKTNNAFVRRGWIDKRFENKEFTQVHWDGDIGSEWSDKKASSPEYSWFDNLISFLLLALPLLLAGIIIAFA